MSLIKKKKPNQKSNTLRQPTLRCAITSGPMNIFLTFLPRSDETFTWDENKKLIEREMKKKCFWHYFDTHFSIVIMSGGVKSNIFRKVVTRRKIYVYKYSRIYFCNNIPKKKGMTTSIRYLRTNREKKNCKNKFHVHNWPTDRPKKNYVSIT